ncbi:hypothetical protein CTRI78_v006848 [Colletotrichum trifolii]|uniref:Uncharacterized protein n=1 Tax=Colletotrichum trifolii TaxID=5466 RepID=A0A4R8RB86_COLTR|nr:hypothetical protein CTRI78_v006848 [Colletotrichum trifolii]
MCPDKPIARLESLPIKIILCIFEQLVEHEDLPQGSYAHEETVEIYNRDWPGQEALSSFNGVRDAIRLGATCRSLHDIIRPAVYAHDNEFNYSSALLLSTKKGDQDGIAKALAHGANVNTLDRTSFEIHREVDELDDGLLYFTKLPIFPTLTALDWACLYGYKKVVSQLLASGADVNHRADLGYYLNQVIDYPEGSSWWDDRTLHYRHPQRVMFCVTRAEYEHITNNRRWCREELPPDPFTLGANPLFFALKGNASEEWRRRWASNSWGCSGLIWEADDETGCRLPIVKALVRAGSSLITREKGRIHALHQACLYREIEIARFLIEDLGVDPAVQDAKGKTPLQYLDESVYYRRLPPRTKKMTELFIEKGVDASLTGFPNLRRLFSPHDSSADEVEAVAPDHDDGFWPSG